MNALTTYFRESLEELHAVRWPTRQQAVRLSGIVLAFTLTSSVIFGLIDVGLSEVLKFLLSSTVA
jgi:preprotein translocase subunit SecE